LRVKGTVGVEEQFSLKKDFPGFKRMTLEVGKGQLKV
jgi:hypothetical protein